MLILRNNFDSLLFCILKYNLVYKQIKHLSFMTNMQRQDQEHGLRILAKHKGGFQFTSTFFPYTSGEIGPYFVQSGVVQCDGRDYLEATNTMSGIILDSVDKSTLPNSVISGGETRDWIFSNPASINLSRLLDYSVPHVMLYKDGKTVGANMVGKQAIHVADLNNEGSSPRKYWVPIIRKAGGTINHIFFYVDRLEGGVQVMQELGLESHAVVPLDNHAWDYLMENGVVDSHIHRNLRQRGNTKESRDLWARNMLSTQAGLERLAELFRNPQTAPKAAKVLLEGYPDMQNRLLEEMQMRGLKVNLADYKIPSSD